MLLPRDGVATYQKKFLQQNTAFVKFTRLGEHMALKPSWFSKLLVIYLLKYLVVVSVMEANFTEDEVTRLPELFSVQTLRGTPPEEKCLTGTWVSQQLSIW